MGRNERCFCGSGRKAKKCHSDVKPNSKLADIYVKYMQFDTMVEDEGIRASCPRQCSICCNDFFFITENEFLLILDTILRTKGQSVVKMYVNKAEEYQRCLGENFPEIMEALNTSMPTMEIWEAGQYLNDNYFWDSSLSCIFLENGKCAIYEARPTVCRTFGVCDTCTVIQNSAGHFKEKAELTDTARHIKGDIILSKRPYPLFYFFSHFLSGERYGHTMQKLLMIQSQNESAYAKYTETLQRRV